MALKHFVLNGKNIAYSDTGAGAETVILAHCSGASHRIFKPLIEALSTRYRVLAPDLAGYGASEAWSTNESFHFSFDVQILNRLIAKCTTPVHVIGYSYGGFLALEAALATPVRSLVLFEPVTLQVLKDSGNDQLEAEVRAMGEQVVKYARKGQRRRAAAAFMIYWGGRLRWLFMPKRIKESLQNTVHKVAMEWTSAYSSASSLQDYQRITSPVLLIAGSHTRDTAKTVVAMLNQTIHRSQCIWLKGASHLTLLRDSSVESTVMQWLDQTREMTPTAAPPPSAPTPVSEQVLDFQ